MVETQPSVKNSRINEAFYNTCASTSTLRVRISKTNKVVKSLFFRFKSSFDYFWQITYSRREIINNELNNDISKWLLKEHKIPTINDAIEGINLFNDYQKLLVSSNVLNDDISR